MYGLANEKAVCKIHEIQADTELKLKQKILQLDIRFLLLSVQVDNVAEI